MATSGSSNSNKLENVENFQIIADNTKSSDMSKDLNNESESEDELEDLSVSNREYKPFRNEESMSSLSLSTESVSSFSSSLPGMPVASFPSDDSASSGPFKMLSSSAACE
jgi:hypothetical protein